MPEQEPEYFLKPAPKAPSPQLPAVIEGVAELVAEEILPSIPSPPAALRGIDLSKVESRTQLMAELNQRLPENEFTLPRYFYRVDLVDYSLLRSPADAHESYDALQDMLTTATVHLDYFLGYPSIAGQPFWAPLAYESKEAYAAFTTYLEQDGARTFHQMVAFTPELLYEWYHCYCWAYRSRAYDIFKAAHHARQREQRILATEDSHYLAAEKILGRVTTALNNLTDDQLQAVDADKLVAMFDRLTKAQRVALGLPANGGQDMDKAKQNVSVEVEMRQIAQKSGAVAKTTDDVDMGTILSDIKAVEEAQSLILRINK